MKDGLDSGLSSFDGIIKRGYAYLARNAGKMIALITACVTVLVTFTDVTFSGFSAQSFTSTLILMLMASYLIYFSLEDAGEKLGEQTEEFIAARARYTAAKDRISPTDISHLRAFCAEYSLEELGYRRARYLSERGYTDEDLNAYKSGEKFLKSDSRILKKASKMRPAPLTPGLLLSAERRSSDCELMNPERGKFLSLMLRLIPSTLCTLFTVSVMLTAKDGLTAETVIGGLLKLSALPMVGFKGYSAGYSYVKDVRVSWLETKTRLLEDFLTRRTAVPYSPDTKI